LSTEDNFLLLSGIVIKDDAILTEAGRPFQARDAATENARSPGVEWLYVYKDIGVCDLQGYNVVDVFRRLCLCTTDTHIRDTLSRLNDLLTDSELDALAFIHRLETFYPHRSFETAKRLYVHHNRSL